MVASGVQATLSDAAMDRLARSVATGKGTSHLNDDDLQALEPMLSRPHLRSRLLVRQRVFVL